MSRWGVVAVPWTKEGLVLTMPQMEENRGKEEMALGYHDRMLPVEGDEFPAGAVEERDDAKVGFVLTLKLAAMREIAEETGMIVSPDSLTLLSQGIEVRQKRQGSEVDFLVACFGLELGELQKEWLGRMGAREAGVGGRMRPRDEAVMATIAIPLLNTIEVGIYA